MNHKQNMTPRERVLATLNHKEPDCIPYDLSSTSITGIHSIAYQNFLAYSGKNYRRQSEQQRSHYETLEGLAKVDEEVKKSLQVDTRGASFRNPPTWKLEIQEIDGDRFFTDELGCTWFNPKGGYYFDQVAGKSHPLAAATTPEDILGYDWPNSRDPSRITNLRDDLRKIREAGYATVLEPSFNGVFALGFRMRGYARFYEDLAMNQSLACSLLDRITELKMQFWDMALEEVGDLVDVVVELDDLGSQNATLISPEMYRKLVKPRHKRLFSFIKEKAPNSFIFLHSDGSLYDILPDLIEMGIDILNPVQVSAANMDSAKLKKEFGDAISFWGGAADPQNVLAQGTPEKVRDEVKRRIHDFAPGGGYVFASIHNIQADVPPENFMAMWETLQENKNY